MWWPLLSKNCRNWLRISLLVINQYVLKFIAFHKQDGILWYDEIFLVVIFDFNGVFLEKESQVAGQYLKGHVVGVLAVLVPCFALVKGGEGIAWSALENIAGQNLLLVLIAGGKIEAAFCSVGGVVGFD